MIVKVKLTQEQVEALKIYKEAGHNLAVFAANRRGFHGPYESLKILSIDELGRVLYEPNSYEVEPQFKVGDWVVRDTEFRNFIDDEKYQNYHVGSVFKIQTVLNGYAIDERGTNHDLENIRHANLEEIKAEKERQLWKSIGREVGEFRLGDVMIKNNGDSVVIRNLEGAIHNYQQGIRKGFFPAESFISFESEKEG